MFCDNCGQKKASYHRGQLHLCIDCAHEFIFDDSSDIDFFENFITGEVFEILEPNNAQKTSQKTCSFCGTKSSDIEKTAFFGCSQCYSTFAVDVKNLIDIVQGGAANHTGKGVQR